MAEFRLPPNSRITEGRSFEAPAGATHVRRFRVYRYDPQRGAYLPVLSEFFGALIQTAVWVFARL